MNFFREKTAEYFNKSHTQSFPYKKSLRVLQKARIKIVARAIYTYLFCFLFIHSPLLLENKKLMSSLFSSAD